MRITTAMALVLWLAAACSSSTPAAVTIDSDTIKAHIQRLASDGRDNNTANRYHKPSDQYNPNWDMKVALRDAEALYAVGLEIANSDLWPEWKPGTEFRAIREQMLKK
jgi:hypothetical protein